MSLYLNKRLKIRLKAKNETIIWLFAESLRLINIINIKATSKSGKSLRFSLDLSIKKLARKYVTRPIKAKLIKPFSKAYIAKLMGSMAIKIIEKSIRYRQIKLKLIANIGSIILFIFFYIILIYFIKKAIITWFMISTFNTT